MCARKIDLHKKEKLEFLIKLFILTTDPETYKKLYENEQQ